ncbi:MAG: 50S ribosomal protein L28 [Patescibacteria group bacterium]
MATRCPKCGKGPVMVTTRVLLRGKYNPTSKSRRYPNLQWAKVDGKRVKLCTDCIKTLNKTK